MQGAGCRIQDVGCGVWDLSIRLRREFRIWDLVFRVYSSGERFWGPSRMRREAPAAPPPPFASPDTHGFHFKEREKKIGRERER